MKTETIDCPALHTQSKGYPDLFQGRVPKTIRILITVRPDAIIEWNCKEWRGAIAYFGEVYPSWTNSHGAVCAVLPDGRKLGVKPDEFEIKEWYDLDTKKG